MALISGPGVFIDDRTMLVAKDLFTLSKNIYKDVIMLYMGAVILYLKPRIRLNFQQTRPMQIIGLYFMFLVLYTIIRSGFDDDAINVVRLFVYMVLGFYFLSAIFSTARLTEFIAFFNFLFWVTGALSVLYILNSSKIVSVFNSQNLYLEIQQGSESFYRDFNTIPRFSGMLFVLGFAVVLMKKNVFNKKAIYFIIFTYPFVRLFSFTRSTLLISILQLILLALILGMSNPKKIFRNSSLYLIIGMFVSFFLIQLIFPAQVSYFSQRIDSASHQGLEEDNVAVRIAYHVTAVKLLTNEGSLFFGSGLNKSSDSRMEAIGAWAADSTIPFWLIHTGVIGVLLFYYLQFSFMIRAYEQFSKRMNPISLTLFVLIITSTFSSLIMGGFSWGDPFVFFNFVLVVYLNRYIYRKPRLNLQGAVITKTFHSV